MFCLVVVVDVILILIQFTVVDKSYISEEGRVSLKLTVTSNELRQDRAREK